MAATMHTITVTQIPDDIHQAIRELAQSHGHSAEAEIRRILEAAVKPQAQIKLGSLLAQIGQQAQLTDEEFAIFETIRDNSAARTTLLE